MKKIILLLAVPFLIVSQLMAQDSPIQLLVDKYSEKKGVTTVVISKDMLKLLGGFGQDKDSNAMSQALANVQGLTILKYTAASADDNLAEKIYKDIMGTIPMKDYNEIMKIKKNGKKVSLLQRKDSGIGNMLLIVNEEDKVVLISLDGSINVEAFSKIAKSLNVDALKGAEEDGDSNNPNK